jgi:glutathione transport system substrate-binding protein
MAYADGASLFPANTSATAESQNCFFVYETLLAFDENGEFEWKLATGVDVSDDSKEYTFKLRRGISFSDGVPWNAESAKYNFDYLSDQSLGYYRSKEFAAIEKTEIIDEYTIKITLKQVYAPFLNTLARHVAGMLSPKLVEQGPEYCATHMVGTGPYTLAEKISGEKIVFKLNRDWWGYDPEIGGGAPFRPSDTGFNTVTILPVPEEATRVAMLLSGEADIVESIGPNNIPVVEGAGKKLMTASGTMTAFLYFNTQKGATADPRVREAVARAIDYDGLNAVVYGNTYARADSVNTATINYYAPQDMSKYALDLERSKALLAEAGYADGLKIVNWSENDNTDIARCEFVQQQLARVGIALENHNLEGGFLAENLASFRGRPEETEWDIYIRGYSVNSRDSADSLGRFASDMYPPYGGNYSYYSNPEFDAAVRAGASTINPLERAEHYAKAQKLIWDDYALVTMLAATYIGVYNPETVEGLRFDGSGEVNTTRARYIGK